MEPCGAELVLCAVELAVLCVAHLFALVETGHGGEEKEHWGGSVLDAVES